MGTLKLPETEEIDAQIDAYSSEWLTLARSTQPLDYAAVEEAVAELYAVFDRPFPRLVFCQSPLELYLSAQACLLKVPHDDVSDSQAVDGLIKVKSQLINDQSEELVENLERVIISRFDLYDHPGKTLRAIGDDIWIDGFYVGGKPPLIADPELATLPLEVQQRSVKQLYKSLNSPLYHYRHNVARMLPDLITKEISRAWAKSHFTECVDFMEFGLWITDWLLSTDFLHRLHDECDAHLKGIIDAHVKLARAAHICAAFENLCLVSNRPSSLILDENGLLHNGKGPAMSYPDGFSLYAWHGVIVPRDIIESPEQVTTRDIIQQPNVTVRRIMVELYGQDRYLQDSFREAIHEDEFGSLYRRWVDGKEDIVMVKVINSTANQDGTFSESWLRVPPEMRTAKQAVAWSFGMREQDYNPSVES